MTTINDYQAEMKGYQCLYCESEGKRGELGDIQMYIHPQGWPVDFGPFGWPVNGDSKMWLYAECLNCKHQWSLSKLRANEDKLNCEYCGEDCDLPEEDHRSIQDARQMECQ